MRPADEVAAEIAATDGVHVEEVLDAGVGLLAGLDLWQRRCLVSLLRAPDPMRSAALASVGRTVVRARQDLKRHGELVERFERRMRRERGR